MEEENSKIVRSEASEVEFVTTEDNKEAHPLQFAWTLWYSANAGGKLTRDSYDQHLKKVATFRTVEEFWGVFNHVPQPSDIAPKADFHIFKEGIEPKWEDPLNESGGIWQFSLRRSSRDINDAWINTVLAVIGDNFEPAESDDIRGIALGIRNREYRLAIWTGTAEDKELQESIGRSFRKFACYSGNTISENIAFISNKDALVSHSPSPLYFV